MSLPPSTVTDAPSQRAMEQDEASTNTDVSVTSFPPVVEQMRVSLQNASGFLPASFFAPAAVVEPPVRDEEAAAPSPPPRREQAASPSTATKSIPSASNFFRWFAHGKCWTLTGMMVSLAAFLLSMAARRSTAFVRLVNPLQLDVDYLPLHHIGMTHIDLCWNTTETDLHGCERFPLDSHAVHDNMYQFARLLITISTMLGFCLTVFLQSAVVWERINLKPVGWGFLGVYLAQSFSFLFFDSDLCAKHRCKPATGCIMSILASFLWIGCCVATAKMDAHKIRTQRRRRKMAADAQRRHFTQKISENTSDTSFSDPNDTSYETGCSAWSVHSIREDTFACATRAEF